ncbi:UPF0158 family protein [Reichenbachiella ulvae]|uniref:UPF0158 family protein n=1 Tax=Reichenbachiella ulvae TaxID=2980104 RepID=A0ABT3CUR8_9BACT|nr:UPF0158 family protein [Reichenbachiella ulvae]MCV9386983.1 UPF0158 family protein [Reichenbachiella ulvae]
MRAHRPTQTLCTTIYNTQMQPTEEHVKEIAELLDCGQLCFFHEPTGTIEHYPDPDNPYAELDEWQDALDRIDADWDNYIRFEKMDSSQAFRVMENFANSLSDENFRTRLIQQLSQRQPFSKFKNIIDNSEYRQNWFDFKGQAYISWVREQLE